MSIIETATNLAGGPLGWARQAWKSKKILIIIGMVSAAAAVGGFLMWQNGRLFNKAVNAQVEAENVKASNENLNLQADANDASAAIDDQFDRRKTITQKEYVHVREIIHDAPVENRTRQADPVIIDTLNGLERMSRGREHTDRVHQADDPVGRP